MLILSGPSVDSYSAAVIPRISFYERTQIVFYLASHSLRILLSVVFFLKRFYVSLVGRLCLHGLRRAMVEGWLSSMQRPRAHSSLAHPPNERVLVGPL